MWLFSYPKNKVDGAVMTVLRRVSVQEGKVSGLGSRVSGPGLGLGSGDLHCGLALLPSAPRGLPLPRAPSLP